MSITTFHGMGVLGLLLMLAGTAAHAACTVSATSHAFGVIDPLVAVDHDSTSSVSVSCDTLTSYSVSLSAGAGTYGNRELVSGSDALMYNLYDDAARSRVWGDGSGTTVTVNGSADSGGTTHSVYGRVPHQPTAVPGSYSDSITVTVTY